MSTLLTDLGSVVTTLVDWAGEIVTMITSNPLLLMFAGISIFGGAVILVKSFLK